MAQTGRPNSDMLLSLSASLPLSASLLMSSRNRYDPTQRRDDGTAFYTKDSSHQIYRLEGVWHIALPPSLPRSLPLFLPFSVALS